MVARREPKGLARKRHSQVLAVLTNKNLFQRKSGTNPHRGIQ
jgi:hypothetical protein